MYCLPHVASEHFARDELFLMPHQVLQQLELSRAEIQRLTCTSGFAGDHIELEIGETEPKHIRAGPAQQNTNARKKLGESKRFNEVVVSTSIKPCDAVLHTVSCR